MNTVEIMMKQTGDVSDFQRLRQDCISVVKTPKMQKRKKRLNRENAKNKDVPVLNHLPLICLSCLSVCPSCHLPQTECTQRSVRQSFSDTLGLLHVTYPNLNAHKTNGAHLLQYYPLYCTHYHQCHHDYADICQFNTTLISIIRSLYMLICTAVFSSGLERNTCC